MKSTPVFLLLGTMLLGHVAGPQSPAPLQMPADAEIRRILVDRIDAQHQGVGIVVGVIDQRGRRVVAHGSTDTQTAHPVNGESVFEIGSATKVFTSQLLADAVRRGELALTDPYELAPAFILTITREGNRLFVQATGQPKFELFAESARDFFLKAVDAQITFEADVEGRATRLILHQGGAHQPAKRME